MKNQPRTSVRSTGWLGAIQDVFSSSWASVLITGMVVVVVVVALVGLTIYLAYGFSSSPPKSLTIPSLSSQATINWYENKLASIDTADLEGAVTALGTTHATSYPWQMYLWRQTSMGALTEWFGPNVLPIDRFTRRLRFSALAEETYHQLPPEQTKLLDAYAAGVNAALNDAKQIQQNEITLLDVSPEPWQPWHTLAIERMFAWFSLDIKALTVDSLGAQIPEWGSVLEGDRALKQWLHVHGFQHSIAGIWPADTLSNQVTYHRLVYGSSATPLIQEVLFKVGSLPETYTATIPGTLIIPSGQSATDSWFILPRSSGTLGLQPATLKETTSHNRLRNSDGNEVLLTLRNYPGWLLPNERQNPLDSLPGLSWKGFNPGTDISAFLNLLSRQEPAFSLLDGDGLMIEDAEWSLIGNPSFAQPIDDGILIGNMSWSKYQASRINTLVSAPDKANPAHWPQDCHNDWAEEQATFLLDEYLLRRTSFNSEYSDAITYLRNWDYTYSPASIGATIFDSWLQELPDTLYQKIIDKNLTPSDTLARIYLQQSITSLEEKFGPDLSKWRLDITKPIFRYYPAWQNDSLVGEAFSSLSRTLYAPLTFPGRGHAATLCWGSFNSHEDLDISARWDGWARTIDNTFSYHWRRQDASSTFLGRYLISNSPSTMHSFDDNQDPFATTIINAKR